MAQTLPNGTVVPNESGNEIISATGVSEMRTLGASVDAQLGDRSRVGHTHSWSQITSKPTNFSPSTHSHPVSQVTGLRAELDQAALTAEWAQLVNKPTVFPPVAHTHDDRYYTESETDQKLAGKVDTTDSRLSDARAPTEHTHAIASINGLQATLDEISSGSGGSGDSVAIADVTGLRTALDQAALTAAWAQLSDKPTVFPPTVHQHAQSDVTGLGTALAGKRNVEAIELDPGADANELITPGVYIETYAFEATTNLNFPENADGALTVEASSNRVRVEQTWRGFASGKRWERSRNSGVWSAWELVVKGTDPRLTDARTPIAHQHPQDDVTGLAEALDAKSDIDPVNMTGDGIDLNTYNTTFRGVVASNTWAINGLNFPDPTAGYFEVVNAPNGFVWQLYRTYSIDDPKFFVRTWWNSWGPWRMLITDRDSRLTDARIPTAHTHPWGEVTGKPTTFSPAAHTHQQADVSGLEALLAGKSPTSHTHDARYYTQAQIDTRLDAVSTAYQVAQADGFTGTVQEWLASLVGPQGVEGPYGGTAVTDPQVASYVTSETETRAALDARYRRSVSTAEYGATGDGSTDDTAAIQATIDAAVTFGLEVFIPSGHYRVTTPINLPSRTTLTLGPDTLIDISEMSGTDAAFQAIGTLDASKALTVDAERGGDALTVASTDGIAPGDWVKVSSQLSWGSTNQPAGEIQRVKAVTATTITVSDPLADGYTTPYSAIVEKVNMVEGITIRGGRIIGDQDQPTELTTGVKLDMVHNASISGMKMRWVHYAGVYAADSVAVTVQDCSFDEALGAGLAYGVIGVWATQDLSVVACHGTRVRHLVVLGGGTSRGGIVRRVTVTGCTASDTFEAGLDSHPGAEDITFVGNIISGSDVDGIVMQGGRFVLMGNTITNSGRHGIMFQNLTRRGLEGVISGNTVTGSKGRGILASMFAPTEHRYWSGLAITGNIVSDGGSYGISVENSNADFKAEGVTVAGNTIRRHLGHGIYLRGVQDATVGTNQVAGVDSSQESIYLYACADSAITGNMVRGGARTVRLVGSPGVTVNGNRGTAAGIGLLTDAASAPVIVMGNSFAGCATRTNLGGTGNVSSTADAAGAYNL